MKIFFSLKPGCITTCVYRRQSCYGEHAPPGSESISNPLFSTKLESSSKISGQQSDDSGAKPTRRQRTHVDKIGLHFSGTICWQHFYYISSDRLVCVLVDMRPRVTGNLASQTTQFIQGVSLT